MVETHSDLSESPMYMCFLRLSASVCSRNVMLLTTQGHEGHEVGGVSVYKLSVDLDKFIIFLHASFILCISAGLVLLELAMPVARKL